jgi:glycosyltransferase involved in cell wall biosynthesis
VLEEESSSVSISVAMCTFNGARFLREQLESIATQVRLPNELIICDDGSTDETLKIVRDFLKNARFPVRVEINESTRGATKNFEKAIALCRCKIIALADQDDVWNPGKLQRVAEVFHQFPRTIAVFSDAQLIDPQSRFLPGRLWETCFFGRKDQKRFADGGALNVLLKHPIVTGATMAFRERFRGLILPMPAQHAHDYWISFLLSACGEFRPIAEPLIQYRQHRNQQIGVGPGRLSLMQRAENARKNGRSSYVAEFDCLDEICKRLGERNAEFPCRELAIALVMQKISHRSARTSLPHSRLLRLPAIFREVANRGYWQYSEGWKSIARDVLL